jgi:hypothetical protein
MRWQYSLGRWPSGSSVRHRRCLDIQRRQFLLELFPFNQIGCFGEIAQDVDLFEARQSRCEMLTLRLGVDWLRPASRSRQLERPYGPEELPLAVDGRDIP